MKPSFPMPVLPARGPRFPEAAVAFALVEGRVLVPGKRGPFHVVAFRDEAVAALAVTKTEGAPEAGTFVLQLAPGRFRLRAFDKGREVAAAELHATLGIHDVLLTEGAVDADVEFTLEVDGDGGTDDDGTDNDGTFKN